MTDGLKLSPDALATLVRPAGIEAHKITSRESWLAMREQDVTASVAAALFGDGVHPYQTAYGLWALKSKLLASTTLENAAMRRGRLLEPVALALLAEERPDWTIVRATDYLRDPKARIGGTPDALATRPDIPGLGIVQLKTVGHFAFKKGWKNEDGDVEIPLWIAIQASVEAALTGAAWATVAAMALGDGGLELYVEDVPIKPALIDKLRELVADFWDRVDDERPYPPDFGKDAAVIANLYLDDDGSEINLATNNRIAEVVARREALKAQEKVGADAEKARKALDVEIINALGNATRGRLADGRVVSAPTSRRKGHVVEPYSYRSVTIKNVKKARAAE